MLDPLPPFFNDIIHREFSLKDFFILDICPKFCQIWPQNPYTGSFLILRFDLDFFKNFTLRNLKYEPLSVVHVHCLLIVLWEIFFVELLFVICANILFVSLTVRNTNFIRKTNVCVCVQVLFFCLFVFCSNEFLTLCFFTVVDACVYFTMVIAVIGSCFLSQYCFFFL